MNPLLVSVLSAVLAAANCPQGNREYLHVQAGAESSPELIVRLSNPCRKAVKVRAEWLPKNTDQGFGLLAGVITTSGVEPLKRQPPINDPGTEIVVLDVAAENTYIIPLEREFSDIARVLCSHDVLIAWTYQLRSVEHLLLPRLVGAVRLCAGSFACPSGVNPPQPPPRTDPAPE